MNYKPNNIRTTAATMLHYTSIQQLIDTKNTVLIACEVSGRVRDALLGKNVHAISCDIVESVSPGPHIIGDVRKLLHHEWRGIIAFPPCQWLTNANNRNKFSQPQKMNEASELFMSLVHAKTQRLCIENPPGTMNTLYRKPNQIIHPYNFGHKESKPTCLWLRGLPRLNATAIESEINYTIRDMPQTKLRSFKRSLTFQNIAQAMADQWSHYFL